MSLDSKANSQSRVAKEVFLRLNFVKVLGSLLKMLNCSINFSQLIECDLTGKLTEGVSKCSWNLFSIVH